MVSDSDPNIQLTLELLQRFIRNPGRDHPRATTEWISRFEINWNSFLDFIAFHEVLPIAFYEFESMEAAGAIIPPKVIKALRSEFYKMSIQNRQKFDYLLRIYHLLHDHGIQALPYKGPLLSQLIYGNATRRFFSDLDFLIQRKDLDQISKILSGIGFKPQAELEQRQKWNLCEYNMDYMIPETGTKIHAEFHWALAKPEFSCDFQFRHLDKSLLDVVIDSRSIQTFTLTDQIMAIVIHHGVKENWLRLKSICDLAAIYLRFHSQISWDKVLGKAQRLGIKRSMLVGFALCQDLLALELNPLIQREIQNDSTTNILRKKVKAIIFQKNRAYKPSSFSLTLQTKERFSDKLKFILARIKRVYSDNEKDHELFGLPKFLWPLYYVLKPIRILLTLFKKQAVP